MMGEKKPRSITTTYHRSYNYGATLQAYALQKTLYKIGFDNEILDFYRNPYEKYPLISGNVKLDCARFIMRIYGYLHYKEKKSLIKSFDEFTEKNLSLTKQYNSWEELLNNPPEADCYICGSDQVLTVRGEEYTVKRNLLSFVNEKEKKYTYAASLADYDLSKEEKKYLKSELETFYMVSVREKKSIEYINSFCDCKIRDDIDPVFLLRRDEWMGMVQKPDYDGKYILYFQVNSNPYANEVLKYIKKKYGLPVVCMQTNPYVRVKAEKKVLDASPEKFLGWIQNAEFVVTTSFHGSAFSILFRRNFIVLTKANSNPIRLKNMLDELGLSDRLIEKIEDMDIENKIDWEKVLDNHEILRNKAFEYLEEIKNQVEKNIY